MKKRVLSALLVLCMACSMVSTVWATEVTSSVTSGAGTPASQTVGSTATGTGDESGADSTGALSDSTDSTSASSDSTSSGSSSAASDTTSGAVSDATSGEGDESTASSDSTAASDSTSSSSSASSDSSDSDADEQDTASSNVTGDESGTGAEEESDLVTEQPGAGNGILVTEDSGDVPMLLAGNENGTPITLQYNNQTLEVYLIDTEGNPVPAGNSGPIEVDDNRGDLFDSEHWGNGTSVSSIIDQLNIGEDYTYLKTVAKPDVNQAVEAVYQSNNEIERLAFCPDHDCWEYNRSSRRNVWNSVTKNDADNKVYLIFDKLEPSTADITVTKTVTGFNNLTDEEKQNYSVTITVTGPSSDSQQQTLTAAQLGLVNSDGTYNDTGTAHVTFNDFSFSNYNQSGQFTVTETPTVTADNVSYSLTGGYLDNSGNSNTVTFNARNNQQYTVTFNNTYYAELPTPEIDLQAPTVSKTAIQNTDGEGNPDGTYDLNLSVTGSISTAGTLNVDVLMIVDESNSMGTRNGWGEVTNPNGNLVPSLESAMQALVNTLEGQENVDARYSIVSFGTTGDVELGWTAMPESYSDIDNTDVGRAITGIEARGGQDGGTNYMAGFQSAQSLATQSGNDTQRDPLLIVVFLSDGEPTYYYRTNGSLGGQGDEPIGINSDGWSDTVAEAQAIVCDQFYSVGIGDATEKYLNTNNRQNGLVDVMKPVASGRAQYIDAGQNAEDLVAEFEKIAGSVTDLYIEDVTITDHLDLDNVEPVLLNGQPQLEVTIWNGEQNVTDAVQTAYHTQYNKYITATYESGTLTLDFEDDYQLVPDYTYTVTLKIKPTAKAEIYYAQNNSYPDVAAANTGTHAEHGGFYSNTSAQLDYKYTDREETPDPIPYPMPVVQVDKVYLRLAKAMAEGSAAPETSFAFEVSIPAEYAGTYNALYSTDTTGNGTTVNFAADTNSDTATATVNLSAGQNVVIALPVGVEVKLAESTEGYTQDWYNNSVELAETDGSVSVTLPATAGQSSGVVCVNTVKETTTTLTLTKTFDGLSDAEVEYLIFRDTATEGFGWDVNYCIDTLAESDPTYMAPSNDLTDITMPGSNKPMQNGGDYKVVAEEYLTGLNGSMPEADNYTDAMSGATLVKDQNGNWTFSIELTVPICGENSGHFFTVYEQHQEVPGYAKINDSNAEYIITGPGYETNNSGTGKFIDIGCTKNIYEDMDVEVTVEDSQFEEGNDKLENDAIHAGYFTRLHITGPTEIHFVNHYIGKLDVTKAIGDENEYTDAEDKTYTLTLEPAHPTKLDLKSDDGAQHGLSGKTVRYYTTDPNSTTPLTIDQNGKITIPNVSVNTVIHFIDLPAIQWKVGEDTSGAAVTGYQLVQSVTDENNDVVEDAAHWNRYVTGNVIGSTATDDGIVSVDSSLDSTAVAEAAVTNEYTRQMQMLTVRKIVSGGMGSNTDDFSFTITLVDTTMGTAPNYEPYDFTNVPPRLTQKTDESGNKISGSYEFTLSGGEIIEIQLPYGVQATVTEDLDSTSGYKVASRQYTNNDLSEEDFETKHPFVENDADQNMTIGVYNLYIDFKNTREAVAPTGLESNHTTPYVLMITAAGMAGLALIGGIVARRIRRRRQE